MRWQCTFNRTSSREIRVTRPIIYLLCIFNKPEPSLFRTDITIRGGRNLWQKELSLSLSGPICNSTQIVFIQLMLILLINKLIMRREREREREFNMVLNKKKIYHSLYLVHECLPSSVFRGGKRKTIRFEQISLAKIFAIFAPHEIIARVNWH